MIRVALLCDQPRIRQQVMLVLRQEGLLVLGCVESAGVLRAQLADWAPDAAVVAEPFCGLDVAAVGRQLPPGTALLALTRDPAPEHLRRLFRQGAADVLPFPRALAGLPAAIREAVRSRAPAAAGSGGGQVVALWSPKGGVGCSLLAANLAVALQVQQRRRTLLVDLGGPYGGADILLGLQPERDLSALFRVMGELHPDHVARACTTHPTGLSVLCASRLPEPVGGLQPEHPGALSAVCRQMFDVVLFDVPSPWVPPVAAALAAADRVLLVVTPDAPSVRAAQAAVGLLPAARGQAPAAGVIVNRVSPRAELQPGEIGALVGLPVVATVHSDFLAIEPLINTGKPLIMPRHGPGQRGRLLQDLGRLAQRLA